ncbi:hypothetical protein BEST7613_2494 [Synechocystis sp. PCC 6803]|nr:hypothetical protein BEST7613_2494 [Synechocystis sp. PCC 6803] [Bacillus subtilis BEST7613]
MANSPKGLPGARANKLKITKLMPNKVMTAIAKRLQIRPTAGGKGDMGIDNSGTHQGN